MTAICVTLAETTPAAAIDRMVDLHELADLFEIRADAMVEHDLLTLLRARQRPLVFTCRAREQGGLREIEPARRRQLLMQAARRGFDYVDVEADSGFTEVMVEMAGRGLIVSHHDFEGTPADLGALYERLAGLGADVVKIAVTPRSIADVGRLLACARAAAERGGAPLLAIALGPMGLRPGSWPGARARPSPMRPPRPGRRPRRGSSARRSSTGSTAYGRWGHTSAYGVLGADVTPSLSPTSTTRPSRPAAWTRSTYRCSRGPAPFVAALPALHLSGFSVTRPFKVEILPHLEEVDEAAALCGSVNTVTVREGTSTARPPTGWA